MSYELNIVETLIDEPKFAFFINALVQTDLTEKLKETGSFTVMAPSNLAFTPLPESKLLELMKSINKANLAVIERRSPPEVSPRIMRKEK